MFGCMRTWHLINTLALLQHQGWQPAELALSPPPLPFRLLHGTSASDDHEKAVLTRLKQQCGAQFTSKMEGMVNDLQLAKEKERQFDEWRESKGLTLPIDMNVTVLTTGFWPSYKVGGWVFVCWGLG